MKADLVCDVPQASTSQAPSESKSYTKGHHRRTSSLWVPPSRPVFSSPKQAILEKAESGGQLLKEFPLTGWLFGKPTEVSRERVIIPNSQHNFKRYSYEHPNRRFKSNCVSTTKYSVFTFIPKNLFEQLHRAANLYFIFIVILNMIIGAFGKYVSILPISFVLGITAIKDAFEDYRRYKADRKINHSTCRVWDSSQKRYRKLEWQNILVGDFVHLSHDEVIPADILLLKSSDPNGICYVDTCNLDGETNLKQRQAIRAMNKFHSIQELSADEQFTPDRFTYKIQCEQPTTDVYKFEGRLAALDGGLPPKHDEQLLSKDSVLLRGCIVKNTDYVEGIVLYAGHDSKAMLNNSGPRYKRSTLEKLTNYDIIWCVVILLILCILGAALSSVFMHGFDTPYQVPFFTWVEKSINELKKPDKYTFNADFEAFVNFWSFIIVLQVLIPISLYVSIEFVKIGQIWFMSQDKEMYYEKVDKRLHCRALNIPEELGQIQYVMSDKTGTLTENQMVFRRCSVTGRDYGGAGIANEDTPSKVPKPSKDRLLETQLTSTIREGDWDNPTMAFFLTMAICNTVVVNAKPHEDVMDDEGDIMDSRYDEQGSLVQPKIVSPLSVDFLEEIPEQASPTSSLETNSARESIELIQFPEEKDDKKGWTEVSLSDGDASFELSLPEKEEQDAKAVKFVKNEDEVVSPTSAPEAKKKIYSIIPRPSALSLAKLRGIKELSPFRRFGEKRDSTGSPSEPPPANSYYDSESPDELALVEAAREYGVRLLRRRFDEVVVFLKGSGQSIKYKVLHTLPFDADRKRMSVIVRECAGKRRVLLLTKGADATMLPILSNDFATDSEDIVFKAQAHLSDYAKEGLRTLCLGRRFWEEEDYQKWKAQHEEAELDPDHRDNLVLDSILRAEQDLELLGVTAIEDRLQDGVPECIHLLREAGIHVWVLTGDKVETAVNIAYSSRLFSQQMDLLNIGATSIRTVSDVLDEHLKRVARAKEVTHEAAFGLVINAANLDFCLDPHNLERFVNLLRGCKSVLCCRATPLQKAQLVKLAKSKLNGKVLAIGDGANDVSMIQGADVGVGLSGQEGMQAVMASDFSLARFRFLSQLLLVHGHWCYHRLSQVILYFFYKNAMFVFAIFWYQIFNGFSSQVPIDPLYLMVYNLIFTSVPPLIYGWMEQDASAELLLEVPALYDQGRLGKKYRWYSFWINMADAVWQSAVIYWLCHFTYYGYNCDLWTFGLIMCAQLLIVSNVHLAVMVRYWTWPMFLSITLSILVFFLLSLLYNGFTSPHWTWTNVKDPPVLTAQYAMITPQFWLLIILSVILCLLPRFMVMVMANTIRPSRSITKRQMGTVKPKPTPLECLRVLCCRTRNL